MTDYMQEYYRLIARQIENRKNEQFENKLAELGFSFDSETDKEAFCKTRLTEKSFENIPEYRELWLDEGSPNEKLICTYWDRVDVEINANGDQINMKVTWGEKPKNLFRYIAD